MEEQEQSLIQIYHMEQHLTKMVTIIRPFILMNKLGWLKNLCTTKYRNGDDILKIANNTAWANLTKGWHVATNTDRYLLTLLLGCENITEFKFRKIGDYHCYGFGENETNESGLTILPTGLRSSSERMIYLIINCFINFPFLYVKVTK